MRKMVSPQVDFTLFPQEALFLYRRARGISAKTAAQACGVPLTTYYAFETGSAIPGGEAAIRIEIFTGGLSPSRWWSEVTIPREVRLMIGHAMLLLRRRRNMKIVEAARKLETAAYTVTAAEMTGAVPDYLIPRIKKLFPDLTEN